MKGKNNQGQLKEIQQLKQENDALKSLCNQKAAEAKSFRDSLVAMEWMLKPKQTASLDFVPEYGDLSDLNEDGLIKKSIPKQQLQDIVSEYLDLLETSAAIYEKNGDYALGIFSSGWCRMMDTASRKLCNTDDNREALESGKWLCHDSCWKGASLQSMADGKPVEVACDGGINLYAVPVRANNQIIGAINFGFGSPPKDDAELKKLSKQFKIPINELRKHSNDYIDRPDFIVDYAKQRIEKSAQHLGYLVERKLEADAIEEIKERHRTTFNSIGDGVITTDKDGRITNMNPAAEHYCGWTVEEAMNRSMSEVFRIVNAKTRKTVADPVKKVLKSEKVVGLANHTVLISKSGKEYQIADTAAPIKNRDGELTGVVLVFSDVTGKYKAEQLLEKTKERYRIISETTSDFAFSCIKGKKGYEMDWMAGAVERITGYPVDDIKAKRCWRFMVHPDDDPIFVKHVLSLKPGEDSECELRIFDPTGAVKWLSVNTICIWDKDKKQHTIYGGCEDITEHKDSEMALLRTQKTVDKSPLSVFWISPEGKFIYVNETAAKKLQYTRKELLSMHVWDIDTNYPRGNWQEMFKQYRETGGLSFESAHRRSDGKMFPVKINSYYLAFEDQEMEIAEVEDITERKQAEEELIRNENRLQSQIRILQYQTDSIQDFLDNALDEAIKLTDSKIGFINLYNEQTKQFSVSSWSKDVMKQCSVTELQTTYQLEDTGLWGEAVRQRKKIILNDFAANNPLKKGYPDGHTPLKNFLIIPILFDNQIVAVLAVANKETDYDSFDVLQLKLLMDGVWKEVERKKSLQALEESEERFRIAQEMSPDGFTILHPLRNEQGEVIDFTWVYENQAVAQINGTDPEEVKGKRVLELFPAHKGTSLFEAYINTAVTGEHQVIEDVYVGEIVSVPTWLRLVIVPMGEDIAILAQNITERKQAEEALRESEERHRRLFETMSQGVVYQSTDGTILSANPAAEKMLGLSLDQMRGKTSMDPRWKMITEDGEKVPGKDHPVMISLRTGEKVGPVTRGIYIPEKDEYVWISITATPLFRPGEEKPYQSYAVFDDITLKKQHEDEINKQQRLLHTILGKLPIGIAINTLGSEPKVELINDNFARIYGVKTENLPTVESFWEAVYEDETFREEIKNRILADIRSGDPKQMRWYDIPITKNGKIFKYVSAQNILLEEQGFIISTVMDTTERKLAEDALKASETKFRSLFEEANDAILIMEKDVFVECNSKAEEVYGCKKEQIIGKTPLDFSPKLQPDGDDSYSLATERIKAALSGENQFFEWHHKRFDGSLFDAEISLSALRINDKSFTQAIVRDITERKLAEKLKAEQAGLIDSLINSIPDLVFYKDLKGVYLGCNSEFARHVGLSPEEVLGKTDHDLYSKQEADSFISYDKKMLQSLSPQRNEEWIRYPDGRNVLVETIKTPYIDGTGNLIGVLGISRDITEKKISQQKMQESEERFQKMLALIPDMISIHDTDFNILYSNWKGFAAVEEHKRKLNTKCFKTYRSFDEICPDCRAKAVLETKKAFKEEVMLPDGCWIDLRVIPVLGNNGDVELFVEWVRDITDYKQAIEKLRNSDRIFTHAGDMLCIAGLDGYFKTLNPAWEDVLGWSIEELLSKPWMEFVHPEDRDITDVMRQKTTSGKDVIQFENRYISKDGGYRWLSWNSFSYPDESISINVARDITERKESEKTKQVLFQIANEILLNFKLEDFIRAVEKQLSQIVDTTNFYIALYDSESGMLSAPFEKDLKDSIERWPAKGSATGLVIEKKQSVLLNKRDVLSLIESGKIKQTGSICESWLGVPLFRGTDVSGVIVVQSYDNPEAYDSGTVEVFEYVSNQISLALERTKIFEDLLHAKNRAEESDRLKSAFLANMSHEIRTPMNGILGFAELLKEPRLTDEQQQQYIEIIQKSGERMLNIINDIVDISRIESGLMDVTLQESNINEQLDYIYSFFKPQVEAKGMKLILADLLPAETAMIVTDREKLYAVLTNLVKNAIKYSHGGTIEFGCNKKGTSLEFFVKDAGIGISQDRQQAIFERFVQADIEDKDARQGAGLGLAISKAFVEMLGGEIWVESTEGKGSTFYFTIPHKKEHQEVDKDKTDESGTVVQDKEISLKILIVEDDELSSTLMATFLNEVGKEILQAYTGKEAVEICRKHPDIDLILMDIKMPVMDGDDAAREIRQFNKDVIIIAQTAKALTGDRETIMAAGFNDYITKPIKKSELLQRIKHHLQGLE